MHNSKLNIVYVVLGVQQDIVILKILPESKRNQLKCSLKITAIFLSIIVKGQVPTLSILFVIRKKATVRDGPWSTTHVKRTKSTTECDSFPTKT